MVGGSSAAVGGGVGVLSVTPLFGVSSSSPHGYLLRCDDYTILLDAGWDHTFDTRPFDSVQQSDTHTPPTALTHCTPHPQRRLPLLCSPLASVLCVCACLWCSVLSDVDCVLLSHSGLRHVGGLSYLRRRCGLRCPVYATLPIQSMGAMTMYDVYQQEIAGVRMLRDDGGEEELFTLDDVDAAFDAMIPLKYSEERPLPPKLAGSGGGGVGGGQGRLRISPHQSGHSVGGAVWRILRDSDVLLYAVDYNHAKERHLDGGVLEAFTRPSLLLMDTASLSTHPAFAASGGSGRKARETRLREELRRVVGNGGVALLPCDSSGRVLELLLFLYTDDEVRRLQAPLVFASPQADATVDFAAQSIEWLSTTCNNIVNTTSTNPFAMEQLHKQRTFEGVAQLTRHFTLPSIILATAASLEAPSISHQILHAIAQQPHSAVIITHEVEEGTLTHQLLTLQHEAMLRAATTSSPATSLTLSFTLPVHVPLEGEELRAFVARQKRREEQRQMDSQTTTAMEEEDEEDDDGDEEDDRAAGRGELQQHPQYQQQQQLQQHRHSSGAADALQPPLLSSSSQTASTLISSSASFYMFPFTEPRRAVDAYGEVGLSGFVDAAHWGRQQQSNGEGGDLVDRRRMQLTDASTSSQQLSTPAHSHLPLTGASSSSTAASRSPLAASTSPASAPVASSSSPLRPPSLVRFVSSSLTLRCQVVVVDFRGLSDDKSWKRILSAVKPRKLVLVHGLDRDKVDLKAFAIERKLTTQQQPHTTHSIASATATRTSATHAGGGGGGEAMKEESEVGAAAASGSGASSSGPAVAMEDGEAGLLSSSSSSLSSAASPSVRASPSVFVPSLRECVDISAEVSFRLALSSSLLPRLRFARVDDYEVAYTEAQVQLDQQQPINTPQLVPITSHPRHSTVRAAAGDGAAALPSHPSVFLGSSKLSDFRHALQRAGIDSEFVGGAVLVAARGTVRIRKASPTSITLQGTLSEHYFLIRSMLYAHFQKV